MNAKFNINNIEGIIDLNNAELINTIGGKVPSQDTSFANDAAYYVGYVAHGIWDGARAFFGGASEGAHGRFSG